MTIKSLLLGLMVFSITMGYSQSKLTYLSSGEALEKGAHAYDNENYDKALRYYNKIHAGDTNYRTAQYEIALTYFASEDYQQAIDLVLEEIALREENTHILYNILGSAYHQLDQPNKAIEAFTEGINLFPAYFKLYYNRGISYELMENWEMAILDYQKSAKLNPYHYSTHYKLAEIAKKEGQYTKAMLCYNSYLLLHAKDNLEFLASYNSFLSTDYNPEPIGIQFSTDDYSDIDELISSKIALDKKYKTPNKLTQPIVKQNYLLLEQLNQRDLGDGFWDSFYVPFFIQLLKDEKFNDYIYFSMQSATNKSVVKVLESNYKKTQAFPDYAGGWWQSLHSDNIEMYNGKVQKVHYYWLNINTVQAIGTVIDGEPVGQFTYYSNVGSVSAIAFFDEDGERTKTWQYFHKNGVKSGSEPYEDGDLHGNDSAFYDNGQIKSVVSYVEGKAQGMASYWNKRGTKSRTITYTDNDLTGAAQYFYKTGLLHYKINYVNGDFTDDFLAFHGNGQLAEKRHYIDNAKSGANTYYYNNGQQSSEANYTEGELNGPFKNWFKDGSLKSEGEYMDNTIIKLKRTYNANGTMATEEIYDEDGKLNGEYKEYDEAGNLNLVLTFKKSDLVAYKVYHRNGSIIKEAKKKGGQFLFENYYSDGTKKAVGTYLPGKNGKTGTWKFYTWNGVLDSESTYENGLIIGEAKDYYASGKVLSSTMYKNDETNGLYVKYYPHGKIANQGYHIDGEKEGSWFSYQEDGTISQELFYTKGNLSGPQSYYTIHGKLDFVDYYEDGLHTGFEFFDSNEVSIQKVKMTGDSSVYAPVFITGVVQREFTTKGNIFHGPNTSYHGNGQVNSKGNYWNGSKQGRWVTYHYNGQKNSEGDYFYGEKTGTWSYYHENGIKYLEEPYLNGSIHGKKVWYNDNNTVELEKNYDHGTTHGLAKFYDDNGSLQHIRDYFYGKIVGYSYLGTDGKPVEMIPITNETCDCISYFSNGKVSRKFQMSFGSFNGEYLKYYENGNLNQSLNYTDDIQNGTTKTYWDNGKLKSELQYKDGNKVGLATYFRKDGTKEKTEQYVLNLLHGNTVFYDSKGNITKTLEFYDGSLISK